MYAANSTAVCRHIVQHIYRENKEAFMEFMQVKTVEQIYV